MNILIVLLCFSSALGFPSFQDEIPNGGEVPHPCKANHIWRGVGHLNPLGGGDRNPFGADFQNAGATWTTALCEMDSDEDGQTNGEELGDPECVWAKGDTPAVTVGISHPGVCTPYSDPSCQVANQWIDCDVRQLQCDALSEEGMQNITVRFPMTAVPANETNYYCMLFELPTDEDYHMVATTPYIDNEEVMHHIILFGCDETDSPITDVPVNVPRPCGMIAHRQCTTMIGIWAVGFSGECVHRDIGFRIGRNGFKKAAFQFHWNNPMLRTDFMDSSGMTLYFTANRRVHDANIMMIGQNYLAIPPGETEYTAEATCTKGCTSKKWSDTVYVTRALNHMHYMGRKQRIEHYRDGVKLRDVTYDELYSYDSPVLYEFQDPIELRPGDELKTTCTYRSIGKDKTTFQGDGTADEMCFGFLTFHPAENIQMPYCTAWKGIDLCKIHSLKQDFPVVDGCNVHALLNNTHPDTIRLDTELFSRCTPFQSCRKECKEFLKEELRRNKCIQGDLADYFRLYATRSRDNMLFWAAIDSCKAEIAADAFQCDASKCNNSSSVCEIVGGVGSVAASMTVVSFSLLINLLMKI
ncbi:tyramine beta-hydroxylase-like [Mizuhopecten yessoensis]|uniref:Tyramine beta-hydroxylase n=1 Tax=Mizuhopecten yessoensis TaxID=6573 RepID=A0A210QBN0_MIZYE|nr:tyramine beta-hydroxylase-like [Mizuhopecten yessoensis]OWF46130.1 Tyramine beta-hydroxylase [Mizuhopecten yessoensis]